MTNALTLERGKVSVTAKTSSRDPRLNEVMYIIQNAPTDSNRVGVVGSNILLWSADLNDVTYELIDFKVAPTSVMPASNKTSSRQGGNLWADYFVPKKQISLLQLSSANDTFSTVVQRLTHLLISLGRLRAMRQVSPGWNGYDGVAASEASIERAQEWLVELFYVALAAALPWLPPSIAPGDEGEVVFEWWHNRKTLTVYVEPEGAQYVKSWGPNINTEMSDGDASSVEILGELWKWLTAT